MRSICQFGADTMEDTMLFRCICMYILASAIKLEVIRSIENFALKMGGSGGGEWGAGKKREGSGIFRNGRAT